MRYVKGKFKKTNSGNNFLGNWNLIKTIFQSMLLRKLETNKKIYEFRKKTNRWNMENLFSLNNSNFIKFRVLMFYRISQFLKFYRLFFFLKIQVRMNAGTKKKRIVEKSEKITFWKMEHI